jgi:hypothetical protein
MATDSWGLKRQTDEPEQAETAQRAKRAPIPPAAARAAHKGIVWLHASAIAIWLLVVVTLGALAAAGKAVPPVVLAIGVAAALGHGLFLGVHLLLAAQAQKRAARARERAAA